MSPFPKPSLNPTILIVDDEPSVLLYIRTMLELDRYSVETVASGEEAIRRLRDGAAPDLLLLDIKMPGLDGLETMEICKKMRPEQRIVALSCTTDTATVVRAVTLGAVDYLVKPFYKADLDATLKRCLTTAPTRNNGAFMDADQPGNGQPHIEALGDDMVFVAASPAMTKIRAQLPRIAKVDLPVLLLGESGVGKEVVARLIHKLSARAHKPLAKINCAALPPDLLESELFGYQAGAFTGATRFKPGKFQLCHQATLLLDEVGEMHPSLQAKLLHVLQDGGFSPLGGRSQIVADVRVLAATNIDVQKAIENKTLREDLYYRLNTFTVRIPPLRERREEIPLLLAHFMNQFSEKYASPPMNYSQKFVDACVRYHWPGNLREFANFVKRCVILHKEAEAISELEIKATGTTSSPSTLDELPRSADLKSLVRNLKSKAETQVIEEVLAASRWNRRLAAEKLSISYKALLYKMKQYEIAQQQRAQEPDLPSEPEKSTFERRMKAAG